MRKNTLKKAMAVMISATMLVTGYTVVSAEGFTDAEALAEMDAFTTGDEAVYVEEVQPEAAQTEEVQPEQTQTEVQPEVAQTEEVQVEEPQAEESQDEFQTEEAAEEAPQPASRLSAREAVTTQEKMRFMRNTSTL